MQIRVFSLFFFTSDQRNWPNARAFDELRIHIWSLLVGLTKCAAHLGKPAAQLAKYVLLANRVRVWPNARAIYQTLRNWSNAAR